MAISALLARIRQIVPHAGDGHYEEIVHHFGVGTLRPPKTPIGDRELAHAIGEFLETEPSTDSIATLGRRLDPTSPL